MVIPTHVNLAALSNNRLSNVETAREVVSLDIFYDVRHGKSTSINSPILPDTYPQINLSLRPNSELHSFPLFIS